MASKFILRLKNTTTAALDLHWIHINEDKSIQTGTLDSPEFNKFVETVQQIYVLVPSEDILLTEVKLPKLSANKLLKALPFALEDQLTEDAASMHFAIGDVGRGAGLPVAVVSRERMTAWQEQLRDDLGSAYSKILGMYPDVLGVPFVPDDYHIVVDDNQVLVRTGKQNGFSIEKDALFPVLQIALKRTNQKPKILYVHSQQPLFSADEAKQINIPIETEALTERVDALLAQALDTTSPINLLQGDYVPAQRKLTFEQIVWGGFAVAAVGLVVLTLLDAANYFILHRERRILDHEIELIYTTVYPKQAVPENPKAALQKELSTLRASRADSGFIRLLGLVGPSLSQFTKQGLALKGMNYKSNQLVFEVEANDLNLIDKLRLDLEGQGLKVVTSNAQRGIGGLIETRFTVEEIS